MKKIVIIIFFLIGTLAQATNYYVATTGNDSTGNGSIGTPWRMPSKAASVVTISGDVINIAAGTYQDNNYCELAVGVSMIGSGKTLTVIKTNYVYPDPESITTPAYAYIRAYSSAITTGNQSISGIGFDGLNTSYRAITVYQRGNIAIHDCDFKDFKASAVLFYNPAANNNMTEPSVYVSGNSFYNNSTTNCTTYGIALAGHITLFAQENCQVYGNTMIDVRRGDVGYCLISGLSNRKIKVFNNILRRNITYGTYWNFTLEFRFNFGENEVYGNYVEGSLDICNNMKKNTAFGLIVRNNVMGCASSDTVHHYGLQLEGTSEGITLRDNIYRNVRYGVFFSTNMPDHACQVDSIAIYRETFKNIGYPLTRFTGAAIAMSGSTTYAYIPQYRKIRIYNNTIVGNGYAICALWLKTKGYYDDFKVKNNIIYNFDQGTPYGPIYVDKDINQIMIVDSLEIDKNIIFLTANSNEPKYLNITPTNTTTLNTIKLNPLFISTTDFKLQTLSPAIDAGVNVGFTFYGLSPDIGAYEYLDETPAVVADVVLDQPVFIFSRLTIITATVATDGGGTVSERGLVYNTSTLPTVSNNKTVLGSGLGSYTTTVSGLTPNTTYYIRAYAINEAGTAYSNQVSIKTTFSSGFNENGKQMNDKDKVITY
jgi:hypothetical protein